MKVNTVPSEHITISLKVNVSANLEMLDCCHHAEEMVLKALTL